MRSEAVNTQGGAPSDTAPAAADVAVSCVANATGAESPATPMEVALATHAEEQEQKPLNRQVDEPMTATQMQNEQRRERHWRRMVHSELRIDWMEQLQRITGDPDVRHLRMCASRYESFVWKKSANQVQYKQKLEHRIESLRRQPSHGENGGMEVTVRLVEGHRLNLIRSPNPVAAAAPSLVYFVGSSSAAGASSTRRDELYFAKLRVMKSQYRDEVALVFRELCRVNTVIQHSASLRRHESNNLGDFLANLKKIIYLLEQQPGEPCGMIPARKRTVEYLGVVESHIQRKVLPILHRLRHTYSTILRPIVLNYMKNSFRFNRRF
ncbi:hypothetical protein GQ600_5264 [Phytophthora cactorum]|nr:hypothetical protein GQ600_5264 [Phytophthora cactorum]